MNKEIYPFLKDDGFYAPCVKGCPNCQHCTDVFYDYTNGIYGAVCDLYDMEHKNICKDYKNDGTEPISIEDFIKIKEKENEQIELGYYLKGGRNYGKTNRVYTN